MGQTRPPLGLPSGSVRALLTLIIVAVVVIEVARGHDVSILWKETLMIAMAHYFTSRRFLQLPRDVMNRLQEEGHIEKEPHPLYLPSHSIRALITVAFIGLAVWLYREDRLFTSESLAILGIVFAYLFGVLLKVVSTWWSKKTEKAVPAWWGDMKAVVVLGLLAVTAGAYLLGRPEMILEQVQNATFALVLFYFGSR